ncbi:MAG: nucleotidyltransferase domain-containing protein [Candidatus Pacearchaeota archaeon]
MRKEVEAWWKAKCYEWRYLCYLSVVSNACDSKAESIKGITGTKSSTISTEGGGGTEGQGLKDTEGLEGIEGRESKEGREGRDDVFFTLSNARKKKIIKEIEKKIKEYKTRHKIKIKTVIIFGSFVTAGYFQDIDIAIIGNLTERQAIKLSLELDRLTGFETDVKVFKSFYDIPELLRFYILKDGIILVNYDKKFRDKAIDFLTSYADFLEWRRINCELTPIQ